jgi:hypothetical protein
MPEMIRRPRPGVRTDVPTPRNPEVRPAQPREQLASPILHTYLTALERGTLKSVSAAKARSLEATFRSGSATTEALSRGRVGASVTGMSVDGALFVRTSAVRPGAPPTWQAAGSLRESSYRTPEGARYPGWTPSPRTTDAQVRRAVRSRLDSLSTPETALRGRELTAVKARIARGDARPVDATPRGLMGMKYTAYVIDGALIVEKRAVRPGATPSFHTLGGLE